VETRDYIKAAQKNTCFRSEHPNKHCNSEQLPPDRAPEKSRLEGLLSRKRATMRLVIGAMAVRSHNARLRLVEGAASPRTHGRRLGTIGELDDAQLVALAKQNDIVAFEALYRRHSAFAMNLAVRIQGHATDAEDIVHDAFVRAHTRLNELREGGAFRSWLGSIVVRLVRTRLRKHRLLQVLGLHTAERVDLDVVASEEAGPDVRAQLAQLYALLRAMPPSDRIAWTLRYVECHRLEGVAELMRCSLATVKRRILRAQRFLGDHFVPAYGEART
jgi:RNA polymerase sigma-70 factor, ECF subfamily